MNKNKNAIIVLGSPNADDGTLYHVAIERCQMAIDLFQQTPDSKIILTGGFGAHFNKSPNSHAYYLKQYLIKSGIPAIAILGLVESANTIEDAAKTMVVVEKNDIQSLQVVTSDFHVNRATFIFSEIFKGQNVLIEYFGSKTNDENGKLDLSALRTHEKWALERLKKGGLEGYYKK